MKSKKAINALLIILAILIIAVGGMFTYKYLTREIPKKQNEILEVDIDAKEENEEETLVVPKKKVQIFSGTDRAIAIMIDNHSGAWPQANLSKAYLVYEIVS